MAAAHFEQTHTETLENVDMSGTEEANGDAGDGESSPDIVLFTFTFNER